MVLTKCIGDLTTVGTFVVVRCVDVMSHDITACIDLTCVMSCIRWDITRETHPHRRWFRM